MSALRRADVIALALAAAVFTLWPEIDLAVSRRFMQEGRFTFNEVGFWKILHQWIIHVPRIAFFLMVAYVIAGALRSGAAWARWRRQIAFLALALALGPGLGVMLLKDHWGRARPSQVMEPGRTLDFTPPLAPAAQCKRNCAFVSGHAAMGFYLAAVGLAFPRHRRAWLVAGLAAGTAIGLLRLAQGAHFLSDIVFAGMLTWFVAVALARVMRPAAASP